MLKKAIHKVILRFCKSKWMCIAVVLCCGRLLIGGFKIGYVPFSIENNEVTYQQRHSTDEISSYGRKA